LKAETIDQVVNRIRELEGPGMEVSVQAPRDRLENFFLRVVEEARAARLETSGVTVGAKPSAFFSGIEREQKADAILDELLKSSAQKAVEQKEPLESEQAPVVVVPLQQEPKAADQVISGLLKESAAGAADRTAGAREQPAATEPQVVLPASEGSQADEKVTQDVLKSLLNARKPGADEENDEASRTPRTER
jgi:hypothetical protein